MIVKTEDIVEEKFMSKVEKAAKAHLVVAALIANACDLCSRYDHAWNFCIWPRYQDHSKQKTQESTRIAEVQEVISEALAV